jgi:hypothetical protein
VRGVRKREVHFIGFLLESFSETVEKDLKEMVVGAGMFMHTRGPLAVRFDEHLIFDVIQFTQISNQYVFIKEFIENQREDNFYLFALNMKKDVDEVQQFIDLDVEKIFRAELSQMVSFHQADKNSTNSY